MKEKTVSWLDSSALLALLYGEAGTDTVGALLEEAGRGRAKVYFSTVTLTEVLSSLCKTHGENAAREELQVILSIPAQVEAPSRDDCVAAGWLRGRFKFSTADAIIAVQAIAANAELVHKDPEFEEVPGLRQHRLPYKRRARG